MVQPALSIHEGARTLSTQPAEKGSVRIKHHDIHGLTEMGNNIYSCDATFSRPLILYIVFDTNHLFCITLSINTPPHSREDTAVMAGQDETGTLAHNSHNIFIRVPTDRHH